MAEEEGRLALATWTEKATRVDEAMATQRLRKEVSIYQRIKSRRKDIRDEVTSGPKGGETRLRGEGDPMGR